MYIRNSLFLEIDIGLKVKKVFKKRRNAILRMKLQKGIIIVLKEEIGLSETAFRMYQSSRALH
jgi:hypothetical protein